MICITGSALSVGLFGVGAVLGASIADVTDWGAAAGLALMFIGRILHGVTGGTAAATQAVIVDVTPPAQRTQALGLGGRCHRPGLRDWTWSGKLAGGDPPVAPHRYCR